MPFTSNPYCALSDVKLLLGIPSSVTDDDTFISTELIPAAQAVLDRNIGYPFQTDGTTLAPATRLYSGNDALTMMIDNCISISQVQETTYNVLLNNGIWINQNPSTQDITADVILGPDNSPQIDGYGYTLRRMSGLTFYRGVQNYQVKGVFGVPAIPVDITRACARLAVLYFKMRDVNYSDMMTEQGSVRMHFSKTIPDDVQEIINKYRRRLFLVR
jgi:hypothetical protein